jgi:hypothetical protein
LEKMRSYRRKHYYENKGPYLERAKKQRKDLTDWYKEFKKSLKCSRCFENHWACLDFHHIDGNKEIDIGTAIKKCWSKEKILIEISKCIVLCANCHRKEHNPI